MDNKSKDYNKVKGKIIYFYTPAVVLFVSCSVNGGLYFHPDLINNGNKKMADLSFLNDGLDVPPGNYFVEISLNDRKVYSTNVDFIFDEKKNKLVPLFTPNELNKIGFKIVDGDDLEEKKSILDVYEDVDLDFDPYFQKLTINSPQVYLKKTSRGFVPPELWDGGISALSLNYNLSANKMTSQYYDSENYFLSLRSGLNLGEWRIRNVSSLSYNKTDGSHGFSRSNDSKTTWQNIETNVYRDIKQIKSRLYLGDLNTNSKIFSPNAIRGIKLSSAENMLPDSESGFAPSVKGVANSVSVVTISQNGYQIYQTTVQPGAFSIDDLYPGNPGDLLVEVKGQNGDLQSYTIPWSTLPFLEREGSFKYAISYGEYRSGFGNKNNPKFIETEMFYGLDNNYTIYGGAQYYDKYKAFSSGIGFNLGYLGALTLDVIHAESTLANGDEKKGQSYSIQYSKTIDSTGTDFQLAGYKYSTSGFHTLSETTYKKMSGYYVNTDHGPVYNDPDYNYYYNLNYSQKSAYRFNISQTIKDLGSFYFTGEFRNYWNTSGTEQTYFLGYNNNYKGVDYSINLAKNKSIWSKESNTSVSFYLNIPFSIFVNTRDNSNVNNTRFNYNFITEKHGQISNTVGLNGTLLENHNLNYGIGLVKTKSNNNDEQYSSLNTYANYSSSLMSSSVGYSRNTLNNSSNYNLSLSGGAILHSGGLTLSRYLGTNNILVYTPNAKGVNVGDSKELKTDSNGYAVINYSTPYRDNNIVLNNKTLPKNITADDNIVSVVPTEGAINKVVFGTEIGYRVLMSIKKNSEPVPFGSQAKLITKNKTLQSIVGDNGLSYFTGVPESGSIEVSWGDGEDSHCNSTYNLDGVDFDNAYVDISINCQ